MKNSIYSNVDTVNSVRVGTGILGCSPVEESNTFDLYEPAKKAKPRKKKFFRR